MIAKDYDQMTDAIYIQSDLAYFRLTFKSTNQVVISGSYCPIAVSHIVERAGIVLKSGCSPVANRNYSV